MSDWTVTPSRLSFAGIGSVRRNSVIWAFAVGIASSTPSFGGDISPPTFPPATIGIPALSLSEAIAVGAAGSESLQFGTRRPSSITNSDGPPLSPQLVPRLTPDPKRGSAASGLPRVNRALGMPIIEPNERVDFKMRIVPPNPSLDFKLLIKDPSPAETPRDK
jgi:hypothetical protein